MKSQFAESVKSKPKDAIQHDVFVWKAVLSDVTAYEKSEWEFYILACNIHDAAQVAERRRDTAIEPGMIVVSLQIIGTCSVYAAPDIVLILEDEYKSWKES